MGSANTVQGHYRWRNDDGSESGASWKAVADLGWTPDLDDMDIPIRLRFELSNTGSKAENSGAYQIYLDVDGAGYNVITPSSTDGVQLVTSATVSDGTTTTEQMAGSQGFQDGEFDSNGTVSDIALAGSSDTEMEYCFKMVTANLSGEEVLSFRVYLDGSPLDGYTNTASLIVPTFPTSEWTQAEFRIRAGGDLGDAQSLNDNSAGDWAAATNVSATMQPSARRHGTCFGLRFKVSAAVAGGTKTLKIQEAKNGGAWSDLTTENHNDQSTIVNVIPVGIIPTDRFADGLPTSQVLSGASFIAGTGEHGGTAAAVTLGVGDHTELEWRIYINKLWSSCGVGHVDGDYYDFRLVESDGTPLTTYSNTPRITLDYDNDYIGGCYPESIGRYGIFYSSDGDAFAFVEESEITGNIKALRKASGSSKWEVVDNANSPTTFSDLEAFHIHQVGETLHLFAITTANQYETFNMSTHAWGQVDEEVSTSQGLNQVVFGVRRSDGTTLFFWVDASDDLVYKKRSSGGVWDVSPTVFYTGTVYGAAGVLADSDKVYLSWNDNNTTIYSQSFDSSDTKGTLRTISTDPIAGGSGQQWAVIRPVYWDDSGTEKVGIIYQVDTDEKLYWRIISDDGAPGTEAGVTDYTVAENESSVNSRQAGASAIVDGTTIYVGYARGPTDYDLYYTSSNNGAAFITDVEVADGLSCHCVGIGFASGTLSFITEEAHIDSGVSGYTGGIQVREVTLEETDDLIATGINTTPVLGTPTLGQEHDLDSTGITGNPILAVPALGQEHDLDVLGITTTPVLGVPTLAEEHNLNSTGITAGPVLGVPTLGQEHGLDATAIASTPVLGVPTLGQEHGLDATAIASTPVLGVPTLGQEYGLDATGIASTPVLGVPTLGQEHGLDATGIASTPVLGTSSLGQEHDLDANDITTTPVLGVPTLGSETEHNLDAIAITTTPVLGVPTLGQEHGLDAIAITTTPVLGVPALAQEHGLDATAITTTPVLGVPTLGQGYGLDAIAITTTPVLGIPTLGQEHDLSSIGITTTPALGVPTLVSGGDHDLVATGIETTPVVGTPSLGQEHEFDSLDITISPVLGTPSLGQNHILDATDITATPVLSVPILGQEHGLDANNITTTPVLGVPALGQIHILSSVGITSSPVIQTPQIGQIYALSPVGILVMPVFEVGTLGQIHILTSTGLSIIPELGIPNLDPLLVEGLVSVDFSVIQPETDFDPIELEIDFTISLED